MVVLLVLDAFSLLLKFELTVAAVLLDLNFSFILTLFLSLFLSEELDVLALHSVILFSLRHFGLLGLVLLGHLVVKFLFNESLAFLFA